MPSNTKVTVKELSNILGVHRNTASKEYHHIIDLLGLNRDYLTQNDLKQYGIVAQ